MQGARFAGTIRAQQYARHARARRLPASLSRSRSRIYPDQEDITSAPNPLCADGSGRPTERGFSGAVSTIRIHPQRPVSVNPTGFRECHGWITDHPLAAIDGSLHSPQRCRSVRIDLSTVSLRRGGVEAFQFEPRRNRRTSESSPPSSKGAGSQVMQPSSREMVLSPLRLSRSSQKLDLQKMKSPTVSLRNTNGASAVKLPETYCSQRKRF